MSPTIKDVAKRAGVSITTVSLVLNNVDRISEVTRKRVLKAIEELDYHPRRIARGLASKKTGNVGFIVTEDHFSRHEPFYTRVFLGTEFEAREFEYYILLTTVSPDFQGASKCPRFILEKNVDGVILAGKIPQSLIDLIEQRKIPVVLVDYYPTRGEFPAVQIDNLRGGLQATQHLIELGHRKIAFIGGDIAHPSIHERFQGYKMALEKNGLNFDPRYVVADERYPDRTSGYRAVEKLLERKKDFTAMFTCNDAMALGALQYLKERGYNVPRDFSLIGFDDVEADLSVDPPLSTMRVFKEELGIQAFRLMVEILEARLERVRKILVPVELIKRGSTAPI